MEIKFEEEQKRAAVYDDGKLIGQCVYEDKGDHWIITTTKVDPAYGGQGWAGSWLIPLPLLPGRREADCVQLVPTRLRS